MEENFKTVIKSYLDERAVSDKLFAVSYAKDSKNIDECCEFILSEAQKKGRAVFMTDDEVYGLAVHYYDEDKIEFKKVVSKVSVSASSPKGKVDEADHTPVKYREKPVKKSKKENVEDIRQMSLF